ncbi:MAG: FecR family protein, partial [Candidatus Contendobacter sp.]|nr:FecR family protein [Candidatus Contendobacter sp.]
MSVLGTAEVLREGRWQPVDAGAALAAGEVVRTGVGSRVAVLLANGSQLKLNANSQLELKRMAPPSEGLLPTTTEVLRSVLRVLNGEIWVRNGGEPLDIQTVPATASIRGTEFTLAAGPEDTARLAVLAGLVEFSNPQGSVLVAANEQADVKLG